MVNRLQPEFVETVVTQRLCYKIEVKQSHHLNYLKFGNFAFFVAQIRLFCRMYFGQTKLVLSNIDQKVGDDRVELWQTVSNFQLPGMVIER